MIETQTNTVWKEHGNQKLWWFCTLFLSIDYTYPKHNIF